MMYAHAIEGIIGLGAFLFFLWGPWQWCVSDLTRNRLFELRDRLFDMGINGQLDFTSSAYQELRELFNTQIRFAHHLNFWRFLALAPVAVKLRTSTIPINKIVAKIENEKTKKDAIALVKEMHASVFFAIFLKSPIVSLVFFVVLACALILAVPLVALLSFFAGVSSVRQQLSGLYRASKSRIVPIIYEEASFYS